MVGLESPRSIWPNMLLLTPVNSASLSRLSFFSSRIFFKFWATNTVRSSMCTSASLDNITNKPYNITYEQYNALFVHYNIFERIPMSTFTPFLIYVLVTTFTPGPNNILSMANAARDGYKGTLRFLAGIFIGFSLVMGLCALLNVVLV